MSDSGLLDGLVISHLGKGLAVENPAGEIVLCHTRRQVGHATVGDRVWWEPLDNHQGGCVQQIQPRRSVLTRPAHGGKIRPVAANLDQLIVVIAPEPEPDWLLVDQYLVACEHRRFDACIVVNKIDRLQNPDVLETMLQIYERIGYACFRLSARTGEGMAALQQRLENRTSMLSGQSGVGKSSLTNTLLPDRHIRTRQLSEKAGLGRHTTTAATLYHLPVGGDLIDSPGVAVFGLAEMTARDVAAGYREFGPYLGSCFFNDCRHLEDKGCAVRKAVGSEAIAPERYRRFLKLLGKMHLID